MPLPSISNFLRISLFWLYCSNINAEQYVVGFAQDTLDNDWRYAQVMAVKKELDKYDNVQFIYTDGQGSTALQAAQINELVDVEKVDVLITSPREVTVLSDVISRVFKQGVPVILLDRGINGDDYTTFIRPANRPIAEAAAQYLIDALDGSGHIFMLEGVPGATPTIHRTDGFLALIRTKPQIRITRRVANFLRSDAIAATDSLLANNVRFDAIYAQSDSMASGARMALKKYNINPQDLIILGIDYIQEAREAILAGEQDVSFTYETGGKEGAQAALAILAGDSVSKEQILKSVKVTKQNVERVEPIF